jgi:hypothetical protein
MNQLLLKLILVFFILQLTACRKDISLPDENLKQLFNSWQWVKTDDNASAGGRSTPASVGYDKRLVFTPKGLMYYYKDNAQQYKMKFSIKAETSVVTNKTTNIITYKSTGFLNHKNNNDFAPQAITFHNDTLILREEHVDGLSDYYIKN